MEAIAFPEKLPHYALQHNPKVSGFNLKQHDETELLTLKH